MASVLDRIMAQRAADQGGRPDLAAWYRARAEGEAAAQQKIRDAMAAEEMARRFAALEGRSTSLPFGGPGADAIARMQAATAIPPGDMPVGAPIPQQGFAPQTAGQGDPVSPTGGQRPMPPMGPMSPGGAMPATTPDMIQTGMAPVGGSAGPTTEIYGESYPTSPVGAMSPTTPQVPSAARNVVEEMMANRGGNAPWLALAAAGFGTAAGNSPHAMQNIGAGGLKGIEMYDRMSDRNARDRLAAATAMLGVEQQDRQAGFRERELGQGERRLGYEGQRVEQERLNQKRQRENDAAKLDFEREKERNAGSERAARADYYNAQAEYTRETKGKNPQALMRDADAAADREAKAAAMDTAMGKPDPAKYQAILPQKKIESYISRGLPLTPELKNYALAQARAAIAKGANPEAVNQRLMQMGIQVEE